MKLVFFDVSLDQGCQSFTSSWRLHINALLLSESHVYEIRAIYITQFQLNILPPI